MFRYQLTALIAATTLVAGSAHATTIRKNNGRGNNGWYTPAYSPKPTEVFELLCGPQGPEVIKPQPPAPPPLPNGTPNQGPPTNVVPEPSTYLLMATGLLGVAVITRRRRDAQV